MTLHICTVDYHAPNHARDLIFLLDQYARDLNGGGKTLPDHVTANLAESLSKVPGAFSLIAYQTDQPVGLINCFTGFSTFRCQPLINVHDLVVVETHRGQGIGSALLAEVESLAKQQNCCKITLEVLEHNHVAQAVYRKFGFGGYELDPSGGVALFWEKDLSEASA